MQYGVPPVSRSQRSGFFDITALKMSKELFRSPIFGIIISTILNILYLYNWYKSKSFIYLIYLLFLSFLIIKSIHFKIFGK